MFYDLSASIGPADTHLLSAMTLVKSVACVLPVQGIPADVIQLLQRDEAFLAFGMDSLDCRRLVEKSNEPKP
jgi:hypothetical protein